MQMISLIFLFVYCIYPPLNETSMMAGNMTLLLTTLTSNQKNNKSSLFICWVNEEIHVLVQCKIHIFAGGIIEVLSKISYLDFQSLNMYMSNKYYLDIS